MKTPSILREAARMVAEGEEYFSCIAIVLASGKHETYTRSEEVRKYVDALGLKKLRASDFAAFLTTREEARFHRVIALLFAALIIEDEES